MPYSANSLHEPPRARRGRPKGSISRERGVLCIICKSAFQTRHSQGRYCSPECRAKGNQKSWAKYANKRQRTPDQISAYNAVNAAIKRGDLIPQPCAKCGATPVDAHHPDYTAPLDVEWLCRTHHRQLHLSQGDKK